MMNRVLSLLVAVVCGTSPAVAAEWKAVPVEARDATRPMPVAVSLPQRELQIGGNPDVGAVSNPYGLVGSLMLGAMMSAVDKRARAELEPVLGALGEFDASAPLMAGVRAGIADLPWLALASDSASSDSSGVARDALLDRAGGKHLVAVDCFYRLGLAFEAVFARCSVQVADKDAPPDVRWRPGKLLLNRGVQSEVALDAKDAARAWNDCYTPELRASCRARWTDSNAKLLKQELGFALTRVGELVGKEISLGADEIDRARKPGSAAIHLAPLQVGYAVEGAANILDPGKGAGMWSGVKAALLAPDSDGVVVVKKDGSLYHKRVVTGR